MIACPRCDGEGYRFYVENSEPVMHRMRVPKGHGVDLSKIIEVPCGLCGGGGVVAEHVALEYVLA